MPTRKDLRKHSRACSADEALGSAIKAVRALEISHLEHLEELFDEPIVHWLLKETGVDQSNRSPGEMPARIARFVPFGLASGSGIASAFGPVNS